MFLHFDMVPINTADLSALLIHDTDAALARASQQYPIAGGFAGAEMSPQWQSHYAQLFAYMADDDESESCVDEVHAFLRSVMRRLRSNWSERLSGCVFTVNECNDSDEVVHDTYVEINRDA